VKSRVLYAVVLIPPVLAVLWFGGILFALLVAVAAGIAQAELCQVAKEQRPFVPAALLVTVLAPLLAHGLDEVGIFLALLVGIPATMAMASLSVPREQPLASIAATLFGAAYIAVASGLVVVLRDSSEGRALVLLLLVGIWCNDSAAYFVGRAFGRHKLAPRISPNKSIEGFVGGVAVGTLVVWYGHFLTGRLHAPSVSGKDAFIMGVAVAFATPLGDLFESMLKRAGGVKDSGHLLGEHGGMLDRLDAVFLAAPAMYVAAFLAGAL
jgi:phosphatidate cytidylyltransferase